MKPVRSSHRAFALAGTALATAIVFATTGVSAAEADNFGIQVENFEHAGPPAYAAQPGSLLAFVQSGMSYDSPADANYVTVVDVKTRQVLLQQKIAMPEGYATHGLGVSEGAQWLYLPSLSKGSTKLHILDGRTMKLAATLDVGSTTHHVDEGTYKSKDFILFDASNPARGAILLDPDDGNKVIGQIPNDVVGGKMYSAWSSPDGKYAYVTVRHHVAGKNGWISKVDLATFKEVQTYEVGPGPVWVAFSADGKKAWVTNAAKTEAGNYSITEIAVAANAEEKDTVVRTITVPGVTYGAVTTADGTKLYTVNKSKEGGAVYAIDLATGNVVKDIPVGSQPDHVFLSPDGKEIWVAENRGNKISIIDIATDEVVGAIPMPGDTHTVKFVQF